MKKSILLLFALLSTPYLWADTPCSSTSGNVFRRIGAGGTRTSNIINVSLDENCAWIVNNLNSLYQAYTTRAGWVLDSVSQSPGVGSTVFPLYTGSCVLAKKVIRMTAYFRDNRLTYNRRDDRFCQMVITDTAILTDKLPPVARILSITTSSTSLTPANLKHHFGAATLTDNCSPLSVLQDHIEFASTPPYPTGDITLRCDGRNRYAIRYRTKDLCGNYSNWSLISVLLVDTTPPLGPNIIGPSELILNNSCSFTLTRSHLTVRGIDDLTRPGDLTYSYRVTYPTSLAGNISAAGKVLSGLGICAPDNYITVRVCAQDCFGNGDLHLTDNGITSNCNSLFMQLKDTIKPTLTGSIPSQFITVSPVTCTAEMPNLATALAGNDNCSDVSIYQLPAPGSILNDGDPSAPGLARGINRPYMCEFLKEPDEAIDCATVNGPIVKSVDVSFLIVDCQGNCTIRRFPGLVQLSKATSSDININLKPFSKFTTSTGLLNYPNPFSESTQIRIENDEDKTGEMSFYNIHGQLLGKKQVHLQKGITNLTIYKEELKDYTGIVLYRIGYKNAIGENVQKQGKMIVE